MIRIAQYIHDHFTEVDRLWKEVFPDDPERNRASVAIPVKLAVKDGLFWVALDVNGGVVGTIMAGWDGHRGWLYSVAVAPTHRRNGIGGQLVDTAVQELKRRGCSKVNLQVRAGNRVVANFYETLGFAAEPRVSMGREL